MLHCTLPCCFEHDHVGISIGFQLGNARSRKILLLFYYVCIPLGFSRTEKK